LTLYITEHQEYIKLLQTCPSWSSCDGSRFLYFVPIFQITNINFRINHNIQIVISLFGFLFLGNSNLIEICVLYFEIFLINHLLVRPLGGARFNLLFHTYGTPHFDRRFSSNRVGGGIIRRPPTPPGILFVPRRFPINLPVHSLE
jgi:hypothetical protein